MPRFWRREMLERAQPGHIASPPVRFSPAWFAGADLRLLASVPSEKSFYNALGATVLLLACGNGFALALAAGYMLQVPPTHLWWLGAAWTIIVASGLERLVLQLPASRKRWLPVVLLPRVVLSLLLAVQLGEPLMLRLNQGEINNYLSAQQASSIHKSVETAAAAYEPNIAADRREITVIERREAQLKNKIEHYTFLSACESNTPSCSYTGKSGCLTYCQHYARAAAQAKADLREMEPEDRARISALRADITRQLAAEHTEVKAQQAAIDHGSGLLAREEALASIERAHPEVAAEVWFLRLLFLSLDLLPLAAKVLRVLSIESPYEAAAAAARRVDLLEAKSGEETARVEEKRMADQGRADVELNRIRVQLDLARRIDEAEAAWANSEGDARSSPRRLQPISAWSLDEFVDEMESHEARAVSVPPALRRAGLVGLALVVALAVAMSLWSILMHQAIGGTWMILIVVALVTALAAYTRGFRSAPGWALRATFATLVAGLVLPLAVLGINL